MTNSPVVVPLEKGKSYAWCACGASSDQPWCNGSHLGGAKSPLVFRADEDSKAALCGCKKTKNPPYCDGSHAS